jgi:hypothetical protein
MGQKLRNGRPCTHDLTGTHNWLAQPHIAFFLQNSTDYLMVAQSWELGVKCCYIGLTQARGLHLSACASDFWTRPQVPPSTQFAQKGCQLTGLELRFPMNYLKIIEVTKKKLGTPRKNKKPAGGPPHLPIPNSTYTYSPIDSSRHQVSEYLVFIGG